MAATPSLKVVKSISYRGTTKLYSNRYHFSGGTPADTAHWTTFSDAVVTAEKAAHSSSVTIVQTVGYAAGSDIPIFSKTYATVGTLSTANLIAVPGDCCTLVRYSTTQRTAKNHPVYLYNYYHRTYYATGGNVDTVGTDLVTAMNTYCNSWLSGFSDGTNTYLRAGPNGAVAQTRLVETYITHRDFPR